MTPTAAGLAIPVIAQPATCHHGAANQVPFSLDNAPPDLGPVHIHFNELGEPIEHATPIAAPIAALPVAAVSHDCFDDRAPSSDGEPMGDDIQFVKGSATHGDVHDFCYRMLRMIRGGRNASYPLT